MPSPDPAGSRLQRVLATMACTVIGISAIAILALLILRATGVPASAFGGGMLQVLQLLPLIGLPIGVLLIIGLIVALAARRSRTQHAQRGRR